MPQHNQPNTLYKLSLNNSVTFISVLCKSIEDCCGSYESELCRSQVAVVQNYLLSRVPRLILDTIFNAVEDTEPIKDPRVLLSVYMHKNIQHLDKPVNVVNKRLSIKPNTYFWIQELPRLQELVHLNLKLNCTDSILKIVGKYCKKLEFINIISKTETEILKTGNALKIRYLVSDEGLQYLVNCTALKEIEMNPILRSSFGGKLTISGIRLLVQSLKCLRSISFNYMGEVLTDFADNSETLPLLSITDCDARPNHMTAITRLCPNVTDLTLCFSRNDSDTESGTSTVVILANSSLRLTDLHLEKLEFNDKLRNLFQIKGQFIRKLVLKCEGSTTSNDIILIGTTCPNITSLRLMNLILSHTSRPVSPPSLCFSRLESLCVYGKDWTEEAILDICLSTAFNIQELCLSKYKNVSSEIEPLPLDALLTSILKKNPMTNLTTLGLCTGRPISMLIVTHFYNECSELKTFLISKECVPEEEDFLKLHKKIIDNNYDLNLQFI